MAILILLQHISHHGCAKGVTLLLGLLFCFRSIIWSKRPVAFRAWKQWLHEESPVKSKRDRRGRQTLNHCMGQNADCFLAVILGGPIQCLHCPPLNEKMLTMSGSFGDQIKRSLFLGPP